MEQYKCRMGFGVTLISEFATQSKMFEKQMFLPFVPMPGIAIDAGELIMTMDHVQYKLKEEEFSCICRGHSVRDINEFGRVCSELKRAGWLDIAEQQESPIITPGKINE